MTVRVAIPILLFALVGCGSEKVSTPESGRTAPEPTSSNVDISVEGPYVLVGHSLGGVIARTCAARHLDRVAGMVLLDSSHEHFPEGLMPPRLGDMPLLVLTSTKIPEFPPPTTPAIREVVETARGG